ncbi:MULTISPECIES: ferredoxin [Mycobacteriales]|uniref:ferredoxin n=1 Tax=Mycobacteriales TaxID=85007 RepID=UPI00223AEBBE|nr:ferredoxin [Dietzia cercidiphylli]MCT1515326.1 ferredoxin [Dietzia cercidiphylli]
MRVEVDRQRCESNGLCVLSAPEVFDLDDDGVLHVAACPDESLRADVQDAVATCPVQALTIRDDPVGGAS